MKKQIILILTALVFIAGCSSSTRDFLEVKEFGGKGKIVAIDIENGSATIDHEKIEGLMSAMTMSFKAQDKKILDRLGTGDSVDFELEQKGDDLFLTFVRTTSKAVAAGAGDLQTILCKVSWRQRRGR